MFHVVESTSSPQQLHTSAKSILVDVLLQWMLPDRMFSISGCFLSENVFHQWMFSISGCFPSVDVFHERMFSIGNWWIFPVNHLQKILNSTCNYSHDIGTSSHHPLRKKKPKISIYIKVLLYKDVQLVATLYI